MNYLLDGVPVLEVVLENPFVPKRFPVEGAVLAVFDTGYEGFALVPEGVFRELCLHEMELHARELILPDGSIARSSGTFGKVKILEPGISCDGFIETTKDVDEIVLGIDFAKGLKFILDYCLKKFEVRQC